MSKPILHHYPASPYAEKIRVVLGFKGLSWHSVIIPVIMPKPDVIALTGGYRRTPILQIGADVYCDTALIVRVIERIAPKPTLYPYGDTFAVHTASQFADSAMFNITVPIAFQPENAKVFFPDATAEFMQQFGKDRGAMRQGATVRRGPLAECRAVFAGLAVRIEAQFADGRAFLFGSAPCAADFSLYHTLWPLGRVPSGTALLAPFARLRDWMARMQSFGHGRPDDMSSADALAAAKRAKPAAIAAPVALETEDIAPGDEVEVLPTDYAFDAVRGELLTASADEIALRRSDPRAGTVVVHFPRTGYQLRRPQ